MLKIELLSLWISKHFLTSWLNQFCQNFVSIWRSYIVNSNINVKVLGLGAGVSAVCMYVCISVCLMSTPCTFNRWQSDSFTYSKYSGNLQAGHTSNSLLSYFWVTNCSKCIYGSMPVSDDLQEMRGYCKLKEEALDHTVWRTRFEIGYWHVIRQTTDWMNDQCLLFLLCLKLIHFPFQIFLCVSPHISTSFMSYGSDYLR